ncbi:MAG: ABC transporter substrate-binding protein, partial [Pseudomonadota bacterium]|nr:ABC transporter substrate-binding protein [Pseudomonadota bacterium]
MVQNFYKVARYVFFPFMAIFAVFCLSSCAAPPVRQPTITQAELGWERQARQLEFEGDYLGAYEQVHDFYLDSLRPDLHQWLLRLLDKMSLESLQSLKGWEQNNELRCQVLEKIFAALDENQLQAGDYVPVLKDILTNCSLSEAARYQYEQLLQSYLSGAERPSFRVGCLLPLTGEYADYGNKILQGMELALEVFHDNPLESHDSGIELLVRDTGGDSSRARELVSQLVDDEGVSLLVGPVTGQAALYAAAEAESREIDIIILTPRSGIASRGDYVFHHFLTMENQAKQIMELAVGRLGITSLALLYPSTYYGRQAAKLFREGARQWGAELVRVVSYDPT